MCEYYGRLLEQSSDADTTAGRRQARQRRGFLDLLEAGATDEEIAEAVTALRGHELDAVELKQILRASRGEGYRPRRYSMSHAASIVRMTYSEYLAAEAVSAERHEYLDGSMRTRPSGSPEHGVLAAVIIGQLQNALRGKPCRVYTSDVRVRVHAVGLSTYPDVSVVCGALQTASDDPEAITNPVVLVEVLSESTEAYDRGAKAARYRRLPTLQEYVLVSQTEPLVELQRRNPSGSWEIIEARPGQVLELASIGVGLDVGAIYRNPLTGSPS